MFSPLKVTSCFSLLESTLRIKEYVQAAKKMGYQALALTDTNVMYGALAFYQECHRYGIKPILGLELEMDPVGNKRLLLLAKNKQGYQNLLELSSLKMIAKEETPTRELTVADIGGFLQGLAIVLLPDANREDGIFAGAQLMYARQILPDLQKITARAQLFLGIDERVHPDLLAEVRTLSAQAEIKTVACSQVRYLKSTDYFSVEVLQAVKNDQKLTKEQLSKRAAGLDYLKTSAEYQRIYQANGLASEYAQTDKLIQDIELKLAFPPTQLPHFPVPNKQTATSYLRQQAEQGLARRLRQNAIANTESPAYQKRLEQELATIHRMGFDDYFLIVWEVTAFARQNQIMVGPGRGSAAGSLVAYALGITDVDPLRYHLLFERFLNEERAQMPDIDLDIPDMKRSLIIDHVHQMYGHDHVAQIITFGTFGVKQALRDVGRVMGMTNDELATWSKAVPVRNATDLQTAYQHSQALQNLVNATDKNKLMYTVAMMIEGLPRHYSTHAAGVILSDYPLTQSVPLQLGSDGILLTQYTKLGVEQVGLLKIDFLGLKNLSILDNALTLVKRNYQADFDLNMIDFNDEKTLDLFQAGATTGVFQFESNGIRSVLRQVHPTSFEDVVAVNALYRPGPMENIGEFVARKHRQKPITYPAPSLEAILRETYGIIVYQEQVMLVAATMGGFSLGQADILRRAMSKKNKDLIAQMKNQFIEGATKKGYSTTEAEHVYSYIEQFANYGFNKSHALAYSKMAFELAYIKAHFPQAFYASIMNTALGSGPKMREYVTAARKQRVPLHGPDINQSQMYFVIRNQQVYFGLGAIQGLRRDFITEIISQRKAGGKYRDFDDFFHRIDQNFQKVETITPLIYSGAFDSNEPLREKLLVRLQQLVDNSSIMIHDKSSPQAQRIDSQTLRPKERTDFQRLSLNEKLAKEQYYLGVYLSAHPVDEFKRLGLFYPLVSITELIVGQKQSVLLYVQQIKTILTKKGEKMAFLTASDSSGNISVTVFPNLFRRIGMNLQANQVYLIEGKAEQRYGLKLVANDIQLAANVVPQVYYLRLPADFSLQQRQYLFAKMKENRGKTPVIVVDQQSKRQQVLARKLWLNPSHLTQKALREILGETNVVLK